MFTAILRQMDVNPRVYEASDLRKEMIMFIADRAEWFVTEYPYVLQMHKEPEGTSLVDYLLDMLSSSTYGDNGMNPQWQRCAGP